VAFQKLKYIHNNPLAEHWQLTKDPCSYKYSSARYYELNEKTFSFLKDLFDSIFLIQRFVKYLCAKRFVDETISTLEDGIITCIEYKRLDTKKFSSGFIYYHHH